jgi:hypothetical protein
VHCGIALLPVEADVVMLAGFTARNRAIAASVAGWQATAVLGGDHPLRDRDKVTVWRVAITPDPLSA